MSNKISVIVPIYNTEKYLAKCLDSIINQTLKELEIICVNDGSKDNSAAILEYYAKKDSRIKIVTKKNGGLSSARNEGMKYATSKYITFVDSDDWIEPKTYELALNAAETTGADFVNWGANIVLENSIENTNDTSAFKYHKLKLSGLHGINEQTIINTQVTAWNKLYKKSIIEKYNLLFPDGLIYEDNEFFYKYALHSNKAFYIDKYLYNYLQRNNSIIGKAASKKSNRAAQYLIIYKNIYEYYKSQNALKEYGKLLSFIFNSFIYNSYKHCSDKKFVLKEIKKTAKYIDNSFLNNQNVEYAKKGKYHKLGGLNVEKSSFLEKLFSITNKEDRKILTILGVKIKIKNKNKSLNRKLESLNNKINDIYYRISQQDKKIDEKLSAYASILKPLLNDKIDSLDLKSQYQAPDFNEKIKPHIEPLGKFYFYPNVGNLGDGIIAEAEYQILNNGKYNYSIVNNYCAQTFAPNENFNLVYGGGGLFVKYWNYQKVLDVFKLPNLKKCVILPSSFYECDDVLECFDERFTVFCREENSYNYCISKNKKAKFVLTDDMAFSLVPSLVEGCCANKIKENYKKLTDNDFRVIVEDIYTKIKKLYQNVVCAINEKTVLNCDNVRIGYLLRTDAEKQTEQTDLPGIDLSIFANSPCTDSGVVKLLSRVFIETINSFDVIITDRLHIGLVATLLDKEVYLLDNSYKKVSGIYEYSMQSYKNTRIISSLDDICIDNIKTKNSSADLDILENSLTIEKFLNIYLSGLKYEKPIKDTIWSVK